MKPAILMAMSQRGKWQQWDEQAYHFFACFSGSLTWCCPYCGQVQTVKVRRRWRLVCSASDCKRRIEFGIALKPIAKARRVNVTPRDLMIELAPMKVTRPLGYGPSAPVHELMPEAEERT